MTELKTLKDMETIHFEHLAFAPVGIKKEDLKQEAIKWIKEFNTIPQKIKEGQGYVLIPNISVRGIFDNDESYGAYKFIKHFFNITKEDLK